MAYLLLRRINKLNKETSILVISTLAAITLTRTRTGLSDEGSNQDEAKRGEPLILRKGLVAVTQTTTS